MVQEDKKVEEEILNRNIKLRAIDLLNNQSINKQYKDLKALWRGKEKDRRWSGGKFEPNNAG